MEHLANICAAIADLLVTIGDYEKSVQTARARWRYLDECI